MLTGSDSDVAIREVRLYNFRHSFISRFLDETGDIYALALMCCTSV